MYVLVGGWPGSGKTMLARALAYELRLPYLGKDEVKEALFAALGDPATVAESQRWGRAAVHVVLAVARDCPDGAVVDSTWFEYTRPLAAELSGPVVELRTIAPLEVVRARYRARAGARGAGHLDHQRSDEELWGSPVLPLGLGPLVEVDTSATPGPDQPAWPAHVAEVAQRVRLAAGE